MRTEHEIEIYLQKKYWSEYFKENALVRGGKFLMAGKSGRWTIRAAFNWEESPQGHKYWNQVNEEFEKWFDKK